MKLDLFWGRYTSVSLLEKPMLAMGSAFRSALASGSINDISSFKAAHRMWWTYFMGGAIVSVVCGSIRSTMRFRRLVEVGMAVSGLV